jgi:uncharacterized protein YndB with AHSA1/START domain
VEQHHLPEKREDDDMETEKRVHGKFQDETGEEFYCPVDAVEENRVVSEWAIENCVEVSTAERYSGNITVVDRYAD